MTKECRLMVVLGCFLLITGFDLPQPEPGASFPQMDWSAAVGTGSVYKLESKTSSRAVQFEIGVVGKERIEGKDGYWLELTTHTGQGLMTIKILWLDQELKRLIMQQGNSDPLEMPAQFLQQMTRTMPQLQQLQYTRETLKTKAKLIGQETVTVPAGTFKCDHYQQLMEGKTLDVWISTDVKPTGLVKMARPDFTMELIRTISDYKSKITKAPRKML